MLRTEGSQERLDNLAELKQSIYEYETTCGEEVTLPHYLNHVALFTNADTGGPGDQVKLMTVHAAKGLEFPYVFLCSMNEGIFPSRKVRTLPGMEEERRLAFVALTRAERGLYLSEADGRNFDGSPRYPSRWRLTRACFPLPSRLRKGCFRRRKTSSATARASFRKRMRPSCRKGSASGTSSSGRGRFWRQTVTRAPMLSSLTGWQLPAKSPSG